MNNTQQIDYFEACSIFKDAEIRGLKLQPGHIDTSIWLHKEKINFDFVRETAKRYPDSKVFIIASGANKGFYIYSSSHASCLKLVTESFAFEHAVSA